MDHLSALAVENAVALAKSLGLPADAATVLKDGSNVIIHLAPAPVVARVATTTALVRTEVLKWATRELDVARYLKSQGAPVVGPTGEADPGPHFYDGYAISLWNYVEHTPDERVSAVQAAPLLRELHGVLQGYPGDLPYLGPMLDEIPRWLRYLQVNRGLSGTDMMLLRESQWRLVEMLGKPQAHYQALHGDAHARNLLKTPRGLLWTDFEDACRGPVAWDIACLVRHGGDVDTVQSALAKYGKDQSRDLAWEDLKPYVDARNLEGVVWMQVVALRFPERRKEAETALQAWRQRIET
jgi:Phosphotransferase enzyme family